VDQLQLVGGAQRPGMDDDFGERLEHRLQLRERAGIAAGHHDQAAFLGLLGRAHERRVGEAAAALGDRRRDFQSRGRLGGRAVGDDLAGRHALEQAVPAEDVVLDLRRAGDAQEYDVGPPREVGRRVGLAGAPLQQVLDGLPVSVAEDRQRIALLHDVLGDAVPHKADADESDPCLCRHLQSPRFASRASAALRPPS
jgi:hypothetical protein